MSDTQHSIDELIDRAIAALNSGDVAHAHQLADQVLAADAANVDAGDLLLAKASDHGEIRRLTVLFCDLVGSTDLSARLEPEAYHSILMDYQRRCRAVVEDRFDGSIVSQRGDGILATFGFPVPHENDVDRAVLAGLDLVDEVAALHRLVLQEHGASVEVRTAVHKGVVFLDRSNGDLYGFAVNVAARLESLADPGTLIVSEEVRRLLLDRFDLLAHPPRAVKGVEGELTTYTVLGPRPAAATVTGTAALVGRDDEYKLLRAAWEEARTGARPPRTCFAIVGESGMGKTRLAAELCAEARASGHQVVELLGSPMHQDEGLWPVRSLLEQRLGITRQSDGKQRLGQVRAYAAGRSDSDELVPLLAALLGVDPEAGYDPPPLDARRLRETISSIAFQLIVEATREPGSILLCDDAQWFDEETRELAAGIVRSDASHLLVLITSRTTTPIPRGDGTTLLELAPLDVTERLELLRSFAGEQLPTLVLDALADRSDGIPLYLEELVRTELLEDTTTHQPAGSAGLATVPDALYEPLLARLYVSEHGASVAAAVATIGREADEELVARVTALESAHLDDALRALLDGMILEHVVDPVPRYRFRHELLREVAYDLQPPSRRREVHGRVADALTADVIEDADVDWAVVGTHYETAGRPLDAATAFDRASRGARRRGALAEARLWLTRAIEVIAQGPPEFSEREAQLRLRRGFLAVSLEGNSSADAATDYERCLELLVDAGEDNETLASTLRSLWSYYCSRGDLDRAEALLEVLTRTPKGLDESRTFLAAAGRSIVHMYRGDFTESLRAAEQARVWATSFDHPSEYTREWFVPLDPVVIAHTYVSAARLVRGDIEEARSEFPIARRVAASLPFPQGAFSLAGHLSFEVWVLAEAGDLDGAERSLLELTSISEDHGFDQWSIVAMTQQSVLAGLRQLDSAHPDPAVLSLHAATIGGHLMMWKLVDTWVFVPYYTTMQGVLHRAAGERDQAEAAFAESLAIGARTGMRFYDAETLRHLAALRDDPDDVALGLREAHDLAIGQGGCLFELRAAIDLARATGELDPLDTCVSALGAQSFPELDQARHLLNAR